MPVPCATARRAIRRGSRRHGKFAKNWVMMMQFANCKLERGRGTTAALTLALSRRERGVLGGPHPGPISQILPIGGTRRPCVHGARSAHPTISPLPVGEGCSEGCSEDGIHNSAAELR